MDAGKRSDLRYSRSFGREVLGHAYKDVTDRYAEQLKEDVDWRKEVAENGGLGFRRKFSWATWATKTVKIEVEESRLTD